MKFAIYSRGLSNSNPETIAYFLRVLRQFGIECFIYENLNDPLKQLLPEGTQAPNLFKNKDELQALEPDLVFSLGGDGTLLDTLTLVGNSGIPVMGVNTGRLGFLANIPEEKLESALQDLKNGHYKTEERSLLQLEANKPIFDHEQIALNDFTIHKRDNSSMVTVEAELNGEYFNTYWADGIIVATPTGSTGYSLSCGGPIIFPDARNFIITPVAPHNLNIRPIIMPDHSTINFKVTGRGKNFLVSLDSRYKIIDYSYEFTIRKAPYTMKLIKLNSQSFIQTLKEKLKWGVDTRNE